MALPNLGDSLASLQLQRGDMLCTLQLKAAASTQFHGRDGASSGILRCQQHCCNHKGPYAVHTATKSSYSEHTRTLMFMPDSGPSKIAVTSKAAASTHLHGRDPWQRRHEVQATLLLLQYLHSYSHTMHAATSSCSKHTRTFMGVHAKQRSQQHCCSFELCTGSASKAC